MNTGNKRSKVVAEEAARMVFGVRVRADAPNVSMHRVALAHRIHAQGFVPELELAQATHNKKHPPAKLHITQHLRSQVQGFHCMYQMDPKDYALVEIDPQGRRVVGHHQQPLAPTSTSRSLDTSKSSGMEGVEEELGTLSQDAVKMVERHIWLKQERGRKNMTLDLITNTVTGGGVDSDTTGSVGMNMTLTIPTRVSKRNPAQYVAHRLMLDDFFLHGDGRHYLVKATTDAVGGSPAVRLAFSPLLFQLDTVLSTPHCTKIKKFLLQSALKASLNGIGENQTQPDSTELLRVPWIQQVKIQHGHTQGRISMQKSATDPSTHHRSDLKRTTRSQRVDAVLKLQRLIRDLGLAPSETAAASVDPEMPQQKQVESGRILVHADSDFLRVVRYPAIRPQRSSGTGDARSGAALGPDTSSDLPMVLEDKETAVAVRRVRSDQVAFESLTIELVLEKMGLALDEVISQIEFYLENRRWAQGKARLQDGGDLGHLTLDAQCAQLEVFSTAKVTVSMTNSTNARAHSFQRLRVRGTTLEDVKWLQTALREGMVGLTAPINQAADEMGVESAVLKDDAEIQSRTDGGQRTFFDFSKKRKRYIHSGDKMQNRADRNKKFKGMETFNVGRGAAPLTDNQIAERERANAKCYWRIHQPQTVHTYKNVVPSALTAFGRCLPEKRKGDLPHSPSTKNRESLDSLRPNANFRHSLRDWISECEEDSALDTTLGRPVDLVIGDLWGYDYKVRLTGIQAKDREGGSEKLRAAAHHVDSKGFINYFGPQRFGHHCKQNALPGLHLLRGEWRAAANLLIDPGENQTFAELDPMAKANVAANSLRQRLLSAISLTADSGGSEESCRTAFILDLGLGSCRQLVAESTSYLWNQIASHRIKRYGSFAIEVGDLVRPPNKDAPCQSDEANLPSTYVAPKPVFASKHDIQTGKYTPHDVVLPIPGIGIVLPENSTRDIIVSELESRSIPRHPETGRFEIFSDEEDLQSVGVSQAQGGTPNSLLMPTDKGLTVGAVQKRTFGNALEVAFVGGYRHLLARPSRWKWAEGLAPINESTAAWDAMRDSGSNAKWIHDAHQRWMELDFELPTGVYPSMLLRELCKYDVNTPSGTKIFNPVEEKTGNNWDKLTHRDKKDYEELLDPKRHKRTVSGGAMLQVKAQHNIFHSKTNDHYSKASLMRSNKRKGAADYHNR